MGEPRNASIRSSSSPALPQLLEIFAVLLMAVLTWAATWAKRKFGIDIEAKHRDALHSALMTGARLAASRQLTGAAAVSLALEHVRQSVPDALVQLAPPQAVLKDLAAAKVQELLQDKLAIVSISRAEAAMSRQF